MDFFDRYSTATMFAQFLPSIHNIDKYNSIFWFCIGVLCNMLTALVWFYPKLRNKQSATTTLMFLSINDLFSLVFIIIKDAERIWGLSVFYIEPFCQIFSVVYESSQLLSLLLLMTAIIQHYLCVNSYHNFEYSSSRKWLGLIIFLEMIASMCFFIGKGYYSQLHTINQFKECKVPRESWTLTGYKIYYWLIEFLLLIVCSVVLSLVCIIMLHKSANDTKLNMKPRHHRSHCQLAINKYCNCFTTHTNHRARLKLTKPLLICGFYCMFVNIPRIIIVFIDPLNSPGLGQMTEIEIRSDLTWERYFNIEAVKTIFNELHLTQFSLKFFFYLYASRYFRGSLLEVFGCHECTHRFNYSLLQHRAKSRPESIISEDAHNLNNHHHHHHHKHRSRSRRQQYSKRNPYGKQLHKPSKENLRKYQHPIKVEKPQKFTNNKQGCPYHPQLIQPNPYYFPMLAQPLHINQHDKKYGHGTNSKYHNVCSHVVYLSNSSDDDIKDDELISNSTYSSTNKTTDCII